MINKQLFGNRIVFSEFVHKVEKELNIRLLYVDMERFNFEYHILRTYIFDKVNEGNFYITFSDSEKGQLMNVHQLITF
jgi:hypothetical protein